MMVICQYINVDKYIFYRNILSVLKGFLYAKKPK